MKSKNALIGNTWLVVTCAVILVGLLSARSIEAFKTGPSLNHVTFGQPVALPGVVLAPGTYTFEVLIWGGDVVRVSNRADGAVRYLGFTQRVERPRTMPANRAIALGEAPAGTVRPIQAWFPVGESGGHRFIY